MLLAVAVFDSAMNMYNRPFFVQSSGLAIRQFIDEVNRAADDNPMYRHAEDFSLHSVGHFDDDRGVFLPSPEDRFPILLVRAKDVLKAVEPVVASREGGV